MIRSHPVVKRVASQEDHALVLKKTPRPHGSWFGEALEHLDDFRATPPDRRVSFAQKLGRTLGIAGNTAWRQLAALTYLADRGVDLSAVCEKPPALMAIEAVARLGRLDPDAEAQMIPVLLKGGKGTNYFREAVETAKSPRENLLPVRNLSDVLFEAVDDSYRVNPLESPDEAPEISIQFPAFNPLRPLVAVDLRGQKYAFFRVDCAHPITREARYQLLIEGAVLRALVTSQRVTVCTNLGLPDLEETARAMREDLRARLDIRHCDLAIDLDPPPADGKFLVLTDYLAAYRKQV